MYHNHKSIWKTGVPMMRILPWCIGRYHIVLRFLGSFANSTYNSSSYLLQSFGQRKRKMTIAASWIRKVNNCEELIFISDSRLCGGQRWDECPKLTTLPGENYAMAFAGDTGYAYPLMMQVRQAMRGYRRIESRAMDISDINGHVLKHINHLMESLHDVADPNEVPDTEFLFGGYSWVEKGFKIWKYHYNKHHKRFIKSTHKDRIFPNVTGDLVVIGDQRWNFLAELRKHFKDKYALNPKEPEQIPLGMEPFEVLCHMLERATIIDTIGGAPQMIKIYQYMNSCPVGVYWPVKDGIDDFTNRTILGRKLFDYEDTDYWFIDPKTMRTSACQKKKDSAE